MASKVARICAVGKFSSRSTPASFIVPLKLPAYRSTDWQWLTVPNTLSKFTQP
jgi:hypothetical protein